MRIPGRGEIWRVDLDPAQGREQKGARPVLVVTDKAFNRMGLALVCPVSQGGMQARFAGFAVSLMGSGSETQGVVMCNQPHTLDLNARGARFVESLPDALLQEVMARLQALLE